MFLRRCGKITGSEMKLYTLGTVPGTLDSLAIPPGVEIKSYAQETPLFAVDAVILFPGADAGARELLRRSGRPLIDFTEEAFVPDLLYTVYLERLQALPRTNYQPIDCNFYDNFEAAIVTRRPVALVYRDVFGDNVILTTRLKDLKTYLTEEFVQLANGEWLRLDRIVSVDGELAGASCRF